MSRCKCPDCLSYPKKYRCSDKTEPICDLCFRGEDDWGEVGCQAGSGCPDPFQSAAIAGLADRVSKLEEIPHLPTAKKFLELAERVKVLENYLALPTKARPVFQPGAFSLS